MASRRARAQAGVQLEEYAFNIFGWAMKIPADLPSEVPQIINAYEPSTIAWYKAVASMITKGEQPWRESLTLTDKERQTENVEAGIRRYILVGITCPGLDDECSKKHPGQKKQMSVGTQVHDGSEIDAVGSDAGRAVLVVTPIHETEPAGTILWALLRPKHGLCTPFQIGQKNCFYLSQYRDDTTDVKNRGPAWNKLVLAQSIRPSPLANQQEEYKTARNTPKVLFNPGKSLKNDTSLIAAGFAKSSNPWFLKQPDSILNAAEKDLAHDPAPSYNAMRKFADNDEKIWEEKDSLEFAKEFHSCWDGTVELDPDTVKVLKSQLTTSDTQLEYRLLCSFIIEGVYQVQSRRATNSSLDGVATQALETVERVMRSLKPTVQIPAGKEDGVLFHL